MPSEPLSRLGPYAIARTVPTQSATINQTCHMLKKKKKKNPRATHHILYFESILYITCKHKENVVYLYIHLMHISLMHIFVSVFFLSSNQKQQLSCTKNVTLSTDFMHTKSPKASNPLCSIFITWALEKKKIQYTDYYMILCI